MKYYKEHARDSLEAVHSELAKKYKHGHLVEEKNAKEIENFLHALKVYDLARDNGGRLTKNLSAKQNFKNDFSALGDYAEDEFIRVYEDILSRRIGGGDTDGRAVDLFNTEAAGHRNKFELYMVNLKEIIYELLTDEIYTGNILDKKNSNYKSYNSTYREENLWTGMIAACLPGADKESGTFKLTNAEQIKQAVNKQLFKGVKSTKVSDNLTEKDMKVDVQGGKITVDVKMVGHAAKVMKLIFESNFSLKNYISHVEDISTDIEIGNTVPFRAIYSVLYSITNDREEAIRIFFQGAESIKKGGKYAAFHFNHLQFIYEYTGRGQMVIKGEKIVNAPMVDYLIINNPTTTDIQVFSVKSLVDKKLNEEYSKNAAIYSRYVSHKRKNNNNRRRYYDPKKKNS